MILRLSKKNVNFDIGSYEAHIEFLFGMVESHFGFQATRFMLFLSVTAIEVVTVGCWRGKIHLIMRRNLHDIVYMIYKNRGIQIVMD